VRSLFSLLFLSLALPAAAATIDVHVTDGRGAPIRDAVVYAVPEGRTAPPPRRAAVMDQKNRMFIPHVLPIQTGTSVRFPNSDDIRHHVYSFSPAKPFQLPLYKGMPANPIVFDRPGVVTLGCNIHDQMSAYIVIVDTPFFEKTGANGSATLKDVDAGRYSLHVWYQDMRDEPVPESVTVAARDRIAVSFGSGHGRT
jgi:plastocyanin